MRKTKVLFVFLFIVITGFILYISSDSYSNIGPNTFQIKVVVYYQSNGQPVSGAHLICTGAGSFKECATTPQNGTVAFYPTTAGNYSVCADKGGYLKSSSFYTSGDYEVDLYLTYTGTACDVCSEERPGK